MRPVIGIAGKARSGKDTLCNMILAMDSQRYRYSFADPIREMLKPLGIDMNQPFWIENKEKPVPLFDRSPRYLMQTLGTEWGRQLVHPDLWLLLASQNLNAKGHGMVIADVRFENEADWVRRRGGIIVHIFRPNAEKVAEHASEAGIAMHSEDFGVHNHSSLEHLENQAHVLLENFL